MNLGQQGRIRGNQVTTFGRDSRNNAAAAVGAAVGAAVAVAVVVVVTAVVATATCLKYLNIKMKL